MVLAVVIVGKNYEEDCAEAAVPRLQARLPTSDQGTTFIL